ncbi:hypothetical protein [Halalkalibacter lacteus]|uniref:hypothetical protein n=1 Tax=Halalkalibacter lacteus TaxID=3090663 RepID=UPI002FC5FD0C
MIKNFLTSSRISALLAVLLIFSVLNSSLASAHSGSKHNVMDEGLEWEFEFESFEDIPKELLDPNYYSEDEIIKIPEEYLNPYHEDALYTTNNPYGNDYNGGFQTFAIGAAAGVYFIPGIGQIAITVTGALVIGGATIAAGSWLYNQVSAYFTEKAYQDAKKDGKKTANHSTSTSRSLPTTGKAHSSKDKIKDGKVEQRRYYDKNGKADVDIDYTDHGNPKLHPKVPHRHDWINGKRSLKWY